MTQPTQGDSSRAGARQVVLRRRRPASGTCAADPTAEFGLFLAIFFLLAALTVVFAAEVGAKTKGSTAGVELFRDESGAPALRGSGLNTTVDTCEGQLATQAKRVVLSVPLEGFPRAREVQAAFDCVESVKPAGVSLAVSLRGPDTSRQTADTP